MSVEILETTELLVHVRDENGNEFWKRRAPTAQATHEIRRRGPRGHCKITTARRPKRVGHRDENGVIVRVPFDRRWRYECPEKEAELIAAAEAETQN